MDDLPIRTLDFDDLERRRVTVFFRFFLALPHLLWLSVWGNGILLLAPVMWVCALVTGRTPEGLREVYAMWLRYAAHVYAYWLLAAEPFPGFLGRPGTYPVDVEVAPQERQGRWGVAFRFVLALPASALAGALTFGSLFGSAGLAVLAAFLAWWACLARARMPQGLRDLIVWAVGYTAQAYAYALLLTARYPNSDPALAPLAPLPAHPVRLELTDELRRDRWLVAFRYVLAAPHVVWLTLWSAAALVVAVLGWLVALVLGRLPAPLHRFLAAWVRYGAHVNAFLYLGGGLFPGFLGRAGSYPVDIAIDAPERHARWTVLLRGLLAIPALLLASALAGVMAFAAVGAWFFALFMGRMPRGLRNVVAYAARYLAQTAAYLVLVTPRYPYSGPADFHA